MKLRIAHKIAKACAARGVKASAQPYTVEQRRRAFARLRRHVGRHQMKGGWDLREDYLLHRLARHERARRLLANQAEGGSRPTPKMGGWGALYVLPPDKVGQQLQRMGAWPRAQRRQWGDELDEDIVVLWPFPGAEVRCCVRDRALVALGDGRLVEVDYDAVLVVEAFRRRGVTPHCWEQHVYRQRADRRRDQLDATGPGAVLARPTAPAPSASLLPTSNPRSDS